MNTWQRPVEMVKGLVQWAEDIMGSPPRWGRQVLDLLNDIRRKVTLLMALDVSVLHRILAGAASLVEQAKASADRETALKAQVADLQGQLSTEQAGRVSDQAADTAEDAAANDQLVATANALDALLKGPETPVVVTPPAEEAPAVIEGDQDPEVVSEEPQSNDDAGVTGPADPAAPVVDTEAPPVSDEFRGDDA